MSPNPAAARAARLLSGPVLPTLLRLSGPNVALALMQAGVAFMDTWYVGRLGTEPLAGLAMVFPFMMLMQMMSAGAMGGGVSSSIARAVGSRDLARAEQLAWHAIVIAVVFGLLFTLVMVVFGPALFALLGGSAGAQREAVAYAGIVFGGAITVWICNMLANVLRGTGNMGVPALVLSIAVAIQVPLAGVLALGWGSFAGLGIRGVGIAYVASFAGSAVCFAVSLARGGSGLRLEPRGFRLDPALLWAILRVGLPSSFNAVLTVGTALIVTGLVGSYGSAALAGYGVGARLELLQVPFVFAIGAALVAMVGVSVGAGDLARARRVSWAGGAVAAAMTGTVGLVVALFPGLWAGMFSRDAAVLEAGYAYLRTAGPCYAFLGLGIALYFAAQGAGRVIWVVLAGIARFLIVAVGGYLLVRGFDAGVGPLFGLIAVAMTVFGCGAAAATHWGVWKRAGPASGQAAR